MTSQGTGRQRVDRSMEARRNEREPPQFSSALRARGRYVATILPCIFGCREQKYSYVPALSTVTLYR
jgi:hypothetical protein